jgi:hypothetical protein
MTEWNHKDEWSKRGKNFLVKISRHMNQGGDENHWCLYAYIYPKHPHFANFYGPNMWQDASGFFDWHGGCTFLEYHKMDAEVVGAVQVGCDYNHLYDDRYLDMATPDQARSVFSDADDLFETLTNLGMPCED